MKIEAMVTGSSSGIGLAIASHLISQGVGLVGLSRSAGPLKDKAGFIHWATDLSDLEATASRSRRFSQEIGACSLLVCCAGKGVFAPSDSLSASSISGIVTLNLASPMLLCAKMLPSLRKAGKSLVVLVGSTAARERSALGASYAATKAGLQAFGESFFMENRKQGVRVMVLNPGMTATPFYKGERFSPQDSQETALASTDLAEIVSFFYRGPGQNMNPTSLVLEPQRVGIDKKASRS